LNDHAITRTMHLLVPRKLCGFAFAMIGDE